MLRIRLIPAYNNMENIKRNAQMLEKKRKEKLLLLQKQQSEKLSLMDSQSQCLSEKSRKLSLESQQDNSARKSQSIKFTDLDTSLSQEVLEDDLDKFLDFQYTNVGPIELSSRFLVPLTQQELVKEAFCTACQKGDAVVVKDMLRKGKVDANMCLEDERNCLHLVLSSTKMSIKVFQILLDHKIDINKQNKMGRTPLIVAALKYNLEVCKILIERKCSMDIQDMYGNTVLHYTCIHGWYNMAKLILANSPNITLRNKNQETPQQCCSTGQLFKLFNNNQEYTRTVYEEYVIKNSRKDHVQGLIQKTQQFVIPVDLTQSKAVYALSKNQIAQNKWRSRLQRYEQILKQGESQLDTTSQSFHSKVSLLDFKCIDLLGKGSFGHVYLVEHDQTKELYAMKVLNKAQIKQNKLLPYIKMQKKILSMVKHPFIVNLHYSFQTHEKLILIMAYCPGGDLLQMVKKYKRIDQSTVKKYAAEIVLGLQCLHKAEIIYRDLKPANVVLDKDGHACITDFGLAKESDIGHSFCGSMAYLAPEMLARRGHTRTIDWYLLGVLIYECYNGKPPFWDTTRQKLIMNIKSGQYIPFQASQQMKDIVTKLLKSNPSRRLGGVSDAEEVKNHPWFKGIDWEAVESRKLQVPPVQSNSKLVLQQQRKILFSEQDVQKGLTIDRVEDWQYSIE